MDLRKDIFIRNEEQANIYVANCLRIATGIVLLIWFLNVIRVFITDLSLVNVVMPIGVVFLSVPAFMVLKMKVQGSWVKYMCLSCFIVGVAVLYIGLTFQAILAWIPPIALSRHYYSKTATKFTFIATLIAMLISIYIGAIFGVVDGNMFGIFYTFDSIQERMLFITSTLVNGHSIYYRIFINFYLPRVFVLIVVYIVCLALSERTHSILIEQGKDLSEKNRIRNELAIATKIQDSMLPNVFPPFPERSEIDIYASMSPSKEVGGDFYDFFFIDDDHLALVIADVSGKGVPAAMFMMSTKIIIKNMAKREKLPSKILSETNKQLCIANEGDMFVTVWLGVYEVSSGKLTACNAGHEYPILKQEDETYTIFKDKHGFVLGGMENVKYRDYEVQLKQGDVLFVYTDGVPEAIDKETQAYGMDRLLHVLNKNKSLELKDILNSVNEDVQSFSEGMPQFDDTTMLAIEIKQI